MSGSTIKTKTSVNSHVHVSAKGYRSPLVNASFLDSEFGFGIKATFELRELKSGSR